MAIDFGKLLAKRKPTGMEVGKAILTSWANAIYNTTVTDGEEKKPTLTYPQKVWLTNTICTDKGRRDYNIHRTILQKLVEWREKCILQKNKFYRGIYCLGAIVERFNNAEVKNHDLAEHPFIMTAEQYSQTKERAEAKLKATPASFAEVCLALLDSIMDGETPATEEIQRAIDATQAEIVTNSETQRAFCMLAGLGFYVLPSGTRSDQVTAEEWLNSLEEEKAELVAEELLTLADARKYLYRGVRALFEEYTAKTGKEATLTEKEEADYTEALEWLAHHRNFGLCIEERKAPPKNTPASVLPLLGDMGTAKWNYYTEAPNGVTKHDILQYVADFYEATPASFAEFMADYPAIFAALEAYIKDTVPQARGLQPTQYTEAFTSMGELADKGLQPFIKATTADSKAIADLLASEHTPKTGEEHTAEETAHHLNQRRMRESGIAIITEAPKTSAKIGFDVLNRRPYDYVSSIDNICDNRRELREQKAVWDAMLDGVKFVYAFDALVGVVSSVYGVEELESVKLGTVTEELFSSIWNNMLYSLYADFFGTQADKERKREKLKSNYAEMDLRSLAPTQDAIDEAMAKMRKIGTTADALEKLAGFDEIVETLCWKGE